VPSRVARAALAEIRMGGTSRDLKLRRRLLWANTSRTCPFVAPAFDIINQVPDGRADLFISRLQEW